MNVKPLIFIGIFFLVLGISAIYLQPTQTEVVEIREYQGEKLDSVHSFRENSIEGPQYVNISTYSLKISGLLESPLEYRYGQILAFENHSKVITLYCVEGWDAKILWEGVKLSDLIPKDSILPEATTMIFHAVDGYTTAFSISEIYDDDLMLAHKMNDAPLIPERGFPLQLVAESKWGYKWIKWIDEIEISTDSDYRGFWEQRGYSNTGNLNESFLR
ncbi:MAG: molybdopterin-dependent oxidoreductase [Candidatus Altiarchaeota archaeon]|nr:molybdopterin-dependent oxidoreductase [Candidatus Altiarchaeota archaeon]